MPALTAWAVAFAAAALGVLGGWLAHRARSARQYGQASLQRDALLTDAKREAEDIIKTARLEAKDELLRARQQAEQDAQELRRDLSRRHESLDNREESLNRKAEFLVEKEGRLDGMEQDLKQRRAAAEERFAEVEALIREQTARLEQIAGLDREEARRQLTEAMVAEARHRAAVEIRAVHDETERTARQQAQKILALAVQRYAAQHVVEETAAVVALPSDEMKGRIIGREGRNIRTFEESTGVDVIIDDTPEAVVISAFDPVRREVARLALVSLIKDGRIHPGRIEEVVERTRREMDERLRELGEAPASRSGCATCTPTRCRSSGGCTTGPVTGRTWSRTRREVAAVAGRHRQRAGPRATLARRCGFLHDIGKAVDHEVDGPARGHRRQAVPQVRRERRGDQRGRGPSHATSRPPRSTRS